ncbi:hypothetical protein EBR43_03960 [bacterium]|nr:hypothetical protein [bacterium]
MEKFEKKTITFQFEHQQLLDLRKILFQKGLNPQIFFSYIATRVGMCDPELEKFYEGAMKYKLERIMDRKLEKADADTIYSLIKAQKRMKR